MHETGLLTSFWKGETRNEKKKKKEKGEWWLVPILQTTEKFAMNVEGTNCMLLCQIWCRTSFDQKNYLQFFTNFSGSQKSSSGSFCRHSICTATIFRNFLEIFVFSIKPGPKQRPSKKSDFRFCRRLHCDKSTTDSYSQEKYRWSQ